MYDARKDEIFDSLKLTRILRWVAYGGFFSIFVVVPLRLLVSDRVNGSLEILSQISWVIAFVGFFLQFVVDARRCPLCGKRLFIWRGGAKWFKNPFSSKCLNCGLRLDGSNLEQIRSNMHGDSEPPNAAESR